VSESGMGACPGDRGQPGTGAYRVRAEVAESERLPGDHHRLVLKAPRIAEEAGPGQFVHVWCHPPEEIGRPPCAAILRRPYSISRVRPPGEVELLLRVRGVGGRMLASKRVGDQLDVIGPLGRGFQIRPELRRAVIAAGGIGLAPVPFLIEALASQSVQVTLLAGAAHDAMVPYRVDRQGAQGASLPELAALGAEVAFVSEEVDGKLVSDLLEARLGELDPEQDEVMAVGPRAMLKRVAELTEGRVRAQVSLEERMACGVGACRSCVVPVAKQASPAAMAATEGGLATRSGEGLGYGRAERPAGLGATALQNGPTYKTVCREGPVFYASEIDWERLDL